MEREKRPDPGSNESETEDTCLNSTPANYTPDTRCRKRLMSATPPNTDTNQGDKNVIETSPGLKQDTKKRVITTGEGQNTPKGTCGQVNS